ncbi:MAG: long-chain-fatty-acid--CoA ligase [Pyrinomonadaceae bacterium]
MVENELTSVGELLRRRVDAAPDKIFLSSTEDGRRFTYAEFDAAVNRTVRLLAANGIGKGETVSLLMPNSVEYVVAYFACFKLGAVAGPVNSLLKHSEMVYVIANSDSKALLVGSDFAAAVEGLEDEIPSLDAIIEFDSVETATANFSGSADKLPVGPVAADDAAIIIYTSGTTGKPKGCVLTHTNLLANARQISDWLSFTEDDRLLTVMPLFHMNAVSVTTLAPLYAGGATVVSPKFSATRFWQIVSDYQITTFGSVATMLSMLLQKYPDGVPPGLHSEQLRFAMCGSAPVPAEVMRQFEGKFNCLVVEGYGLSESTCRSTFNPPDRTRKPGSCGLPIGNELRIVDDNDVDVPEGERGEIVLRGENIFKEYFRNPDATATAFRGGWFHTGDVAYRDADGFVFIVDRKSDMIIRGGENIYPREIDEVLYQNPAVAAAAAIGVPDQLYGEEVAAFVVLKEGAAATEIEIMEFCRARLADYKCPKSVRFVKEIPKGPTGKLLKRELAKMV